MRQLVFSGVVSVGVCFVLASCTGCAAFPANRLPKLNDITSPAPPSNKPTVCLALRFMRKKGDDKPGNPS